jgi:hypothetical protein
MHEPAFVRCVRRINELPRDVERLRDRNRPPCDPPRKRLAFDQLEHERVNAAVFLQAVDRRFG